MDYAAKRIGMTGTANNGLKMTIIAYRSYDDIDIQFEDGVIVEHKQYGNFIAGTVRHPNYTNKGKSRLHERNQNSIGEWMEITKYNHEDDVEVTFDNGPVVQHKTYRNFIKGKIHMPNTRNHGNAHDKWIGKTNLTTAGEKMTIVEYNSWKDITVEFETTKTRKKTTLGQFKEGIVKNKDFQCHIGEMSINHQGCKMNIYKKIGVNKYLVQFEDGTITAKAYSFNCFKNGYVPNPNFRDPRIGMIKRMRNGLMAKLIDMKDSKNLIILFEDGIIVDHVRNDDFFTANAVTHPDLTGTGIHHYYGYTVQKASSIPMPNGEFLYKTIKDGESTPYLMSLQELLDKEGIPRIDFLKESEAS